MPDTGVLGPGTSYPWDPQNQQPPATATLTAPALNAGGPAAPPARYLSPQEQAAIINSLGGREGWFVVGGAAVPETKLGTDSLGRSVNVPTGNYTIQISNGKGNTDTVGIYPGNPDAAGNPTWVPSKAPADIKVDQTHPNITGQDGNTYVWDTAQGKYVQAPGLPQGQPKPTEGQTRKAVENGRNVDQTFSGGQWVTTKIGDPAVPGAAVEGATRQIVDNGRNVTQVYQNGAWVTTALGASAIPGAAQEGQQRQIVEGGKNVQQVYQNGQWVTTNVLGAAGPGAASEGDKRQIVEGGKNVQQVFMNGAWVTTGVLGAAGPGAANEGDTRTTIENGRNVNQTFKNGQWLTTGLGESALPGAAKEGDTRKNVQGGFTIQEVYKNGQWIADPSVPPVRFTPTEPTVVSAPATQANLAIMQNGQLTTQLNPNFMPTSTAEVAARVAQLQSLATQQRDQLSEQQLAGTITADQAAQKFQSWWAQNVEPQKAALDAAQRSATIAEQQKISEQNRANYATALTAGSQAVEAAKAQLPYRVGPGFGQAVNQIAAAYGSGKPATGVDIASAVQFQMPDLNQLAQKATDQALAHISPTAAQNLNAATGASVPNYGPQMAQLPQNMDMNQALNQQRYMPSVTVSPDGTVHIQQQPGAQPPPPPPPPPPPGMAAQANPGVNVGAFPGAGPGGAQSTPLPYTYPNPGVNPAEMPGAGPGGMQSTMLPYVPGTLM